jgi:hypothetical protein
MIAIITHSIEGRVINKYRGTFMGENLMEPNLCNGIFASVTGFFEAWSGSYESKLAGARIVSNKKLDHYLLSGQRHSTIANTSVLTCLTPLTATLASTARHRYPDNKTRLNII